MCVLYCIAYVCVCVFVSVGVTLPSIVTSVGVIPLMLSHQKPRAIRVCLERMAKTFNGTSVVDKNHDLILYQMTKGREGLELNAIRLSLLLQEQQQKPS